MSFTGSKWSSCQEMFLWSFIEGPIGRAEFVDDVDRAHAGFGKILSIYDLTDDAIQTLKRGLGNFAPYKIWFGPLVVRLLKDEYSNFSVVSK